MLFNSEKKTVAPSSSMTASYFADEAALLRSFLDSIPSNAKIEQAIAETAADIVVKLREYDQSQSGVINFLRYYNLSTQEGIILMSLAESLLRIPDADTKALLLREKLTSADWQQHISESGSALVDVATRALVMTKGMLKESGTSVFSRVWGGMVKRLGEPVIKTAVKQAIQMLSYYFVLGNTIEESIKKAEPQCEAGIGFSYDMLGEAAKTQADADVYFEKYKHAIAMIAADSTKAGNKKATQGISIKLSALHCRYEVSQQERCVPELAARLKELALSAQAAGMSLTVDAEEADRLDMSLEIIQRVLQDSEISPEWAGFGLAVQAYSKRALPVLRWVVSQAKKHGKTLEVRLVKGAYWDTEIKLSQMNGEDDYPLFTRKENTDVSYLACAEYMLQESSVISPIFATHNAYTIAYILQRYKALGVKKPAFQVLQGMGAGVMHVLSPQLCGETFSRMVYAPVGHHADLLPYLVRRILENGVNSSFVNQLSDTSIPIEKLIQSPIQTVKQWMSEDKVSVLAKPGDIFSPERQNSSGLCLANQQEFDAVREDLQQWDGKQWAAGYQGSLKEKDNPRVTTVHAPFDPDFMIGKLYWTRSEYSAEALAVAEEAHKEWSLRSIEERAQCLERLADLLRKHRSELLYLLIHEAGKVLPDAVSEIREAEDFCRYYAATARKDLSPQLMPGYTGETNELRLVGRGVLLCISPWNFPAAIFLGQIVAALVSGNTVIAKPATNTSIIATRLTQLAHEAGIPKTCLHLLCDSGSKIGNICVPDERVAGVVFTGSTSVAKGIQRQLAAREGAIVPLIAETGGLNSLIADTSALSEQLVTDVMESAFGSSGQRCSALRLLLLPEETASSVLDMLRGAIAEWVVGNPRELNTDSGPVIDQSSADSINEYIKELSGRATLVGRAAETDASKKGSYVVPCCYEVSCVAELKEEIFGPVLHVVRYKSSELDQVIEQINGLGYGLTFGVHSRIGARVQGICDSVAIGNIYINRNIIGAVVGVNPFGGSGLSGTGPKAGGPHYLPRLCHEVTVTNNITALGGNIELIQSLME
jgi:RHH-type transcriptional regulator, proline utilization regulon repressor / proline dehydrogenase / delta 1-pyrroline-5-carboxylate dehydrogenase